MRSPVNSGTGHFPSHVNRRTLEMDRAAQLRCQAVVVAVDRALDIQAAARGMAKAAGASGDRHRSFKFATRAYHRVVGLCPAADRSSVRIGSEDGRPTGGRFDREANYHRAVEGPRSITAIVDRQAMRADQGQVRVLVDRQRACRTCGESAGWESHHRGQDQHKEQVSV